MTYCRRNRGKLLLVKKFSNYRKNLGNQCLDADLCNCRRNRVKLFLLVKKLSLLDANQLIIIYHHADGQGKKRLQETYGKKDFRLDFLLPLLWGARSPPCFSI